MNPASFFRLRPVRPDPRRWRRARRVPRGRSAVVDLQLRRQPSTQPAPPFRPPTAATPALWSRTRRCPAPRKPAWMRPPPSCGPTAGGSATGGARAGDGRRALARADRLPGRTRAPRPGRTAARAGPACYGGAVYQPGEASPPTTAATPAPVSPTAAAGARGRLPARATRAPPATWRRATNTATSAGCASSSSGRCSSPATGTRARARPSWWERSAALLRAAAAPPAGPAAPSPPPSWRRPSCTPTSRRRWPRPTPPVFGRDLRPVDGTVLEVKRADGRGFLMGARLQRPHRLPEHPRRHRPARPPAARPGPPAAGGPGLPGAPSPERRGRGLGRRRGGGGRGGGRRERRGRRRGRPPAAGWRGA